MLEAGFGSLESFNEAIRFTFAAAGQRASEEDGGGGEVAAEDSGRSLLGQVNLRRTAGGAQLAHTHLTSSQKKLTAVRTLSDAPRSQRLSSSSPLGGGSSAWGTCEHRPGEELL